jgi:hypothetical protein
MSYHPSCKEDGLGAASFPRRALDFNAGGLGRDIKLVEAQGEFAAYVYLSYCWGGINSITTTKSTLPLRSAGTSRDSLPQMFKDAIDVTRRLKVRYLWIDALCTIQGWHDIVRSYIPLSLAFDSDRLPALSGPAKRMQKQLDYDYLAGLWNCDLWNELRWRFHDGAESSTRGAPTRLANIGAHPGHGSLLRTFRIGYTPRIPRRTLKRIFVFFVF